MIEKRTTRAQDRELSRLDGLTSPYHLEGATEAAAINQNATFTDWSQDAIDNCIMLDLNVWRIKRARGLSPVKSHQVFGESGISRKVAWIGHIAQNNKLRGF